MKLAALFSGGKDSTYSIYLAQKAGYEIKYLITMFPESSESFMFHHPCIEITKIQSKLLGIDQIVQKTTGQRDKELSDLKTTLEKVKNKIDGVLFGTIASNYQKKHIERICKDVGLKTVAPLWQKNPKELLIEQIKEGFEIIITGVFAEGFDKNWLGRRIDEKCIDELTELNRKYGINISGEGGEYETLVIDCPLFKKKIKIEKVDIIWDEKTNSGYLIIKNVRLVGRRGGTR